MTDQETDAPVLAREAPEEVISRCLAGRELWGDDLDEHDIARWYASEEQGYRAIKQARIDSGRSKPGDHYKEVNQLYGFDLLPSGAIGNVLSLGGYDGAETRPLWDRLDSVTIVDPAFGTRTEKRDGVELYFSTPDPSGQMAFDDGTFDLSLALSVLHHIPNVSLVLSELTRVTRPGGHIILREPMVSMGDWRTRSTNALTPNERGLPWRWLQSKLASLPVDVVSLRLWNFPIIPRVCDRLGLGQAYNSRAFTLLDRAMSGLTSWNARYHRPSFMQKLAPTAFFAVLRRRTES